MERYRRTAALGLVILGGVLLFLAPDSVFGIVLVSVGILIEVIGIYLERRG